MGVVNENFVRCTECDHAHFIPIEVVLIGKGSSYETPIIIDRKHQYNCAICGHTQYSNLI